MTYVDGPFAEHRGQWAGGCHLAADTMEELHEFAVSLGLRREWLHDGRRPHYDLTAPKRELALARGAREVRSRELLRVALASR